MKLGLVSLLALSIVSVAGCAQHRYFRPTGFYADSLQYRIAPDASGAMMPAGYLLDNFVDRGAAEPRRPRDDEPYRATMALRTHDGRVYRASRRIYDVRYVRASDGAEVWTRTIPIERRTRDLSLEVVARQYVARVSGTRAALVELGGETIVSEHRVAARTLDERALEVDGVEAFATTFELVDLDRREVDPDAPRAVVRVVLVRLPTRLTAVADPMDTWPAMLVVGMQAPRASFDEVRADFDSLLSRIVVWRRTTGDADREPRRRGVVSGPTLASMEGVTERAPDARVAATSGGSSETRYRAGDWVVYRYSGSALPEPVTLHEAIESVDGARLSIVVTMTRGAETRRFVQVVTDTEANRAAGIVDELWAIDGDRRTRLPNTRNADLLRLYDWVLLPLEGAVEEESSAEQARAFAGEHHSCRVRSGVRRLGARRVRFEESECAAFLWTHGPARYVDADSGEILEEVEVSAAGRGR